MSQPYSNSNNNQSEKTIPLDKFQQVLENYATEQEKVKKLTEMLTNSKLENEKLRKGFDAINKGDDDPFMELDDMKDFFTVNKFNRIEFIIL